MHEIPMPARRPARAHPVPVCTCTCRPRAGWGGPPIAAPPKWRHATKTADYCIRDARRNFQQLSSRCDSTRKSWPTGLALSYLTGRVWWTRRGLTKDRVRLKDRCCVFSVFLIRCQIWCMLHTNVFQSTSSSLEYTQDLRGHPTLDLCVTLSTHTHTHRLQAEVVPPERQSALLLQTGWVWWVAGESLALALMILSWFSNCQCNCIVLWCVCCGHLHSNLTFHLRMEEKRS